MIRKQGESTRPEDIISPQVIHTVLARCVVAWLEADTERPVIAYGTLFFRAAGIVLLLYNFITVGATPHHYPNVGDQSLNLS